MLSRLCAALTATTLFASLSIADTWNKKTTLTVNQTVMVAGKILEPGKYVLKLLESPADRHIVCLTNEREDQVITTVLAIPNYRLKPTGNTAFQWWETPAGNPPALRAWFYPGDNFGQEFVYPKGLAARIAATTQLPVPTTAARSEAELKTAPLTVTEPSGEEKELAVTVPSAPPKPEPVLRAEATPPETPAPAAAPAVPAAPEPARTLPDTASPFVTIGALGVLALAAGFALRALTHHL